MTSKKTESILTNKNLVVLSSLSIAIAGCSSSGSPSGGDAGVGGSSTGRGGASGSGGTSTGGTSSSGGASSGGTDGSVSGPTITISGVAVDASNGTAATNFDGSKYPALSGVRVCVYANPSVPCVMTDADGKYSLPGVPASQTPPYVSYEKAGYRPLLYGSISLAAPLDAPVAFMFSTAYYISFETKGGASPDTTTGDILFGATTFGPSTSPFHEVFQGTLLYYVKGYKVALTPAPKAGPIYVSATWQPDASLKSSSAAGWGFFQAAPGDYALAFTYAGMPCGATTTKVVAGYSTLYVGALCAPTGPLPDASTGAPDGAADAAPDSG